MARPTGPSSALASSRMWSSIDAAAKWLRGLGIGQIALELTHWQPGQKSLSIWLLVRSDGTSPEQMCRAASYR
jgi:hypothetical protein